VLGIALNKILGKTFDKFDDFINYFAFSQWEEFNSSRILALASVPLFVFGGYCLLMYNKQQNRFPKNSQERKYQNRPVDFFALSYVFSIIGFLLNKNEIFLTANIFVPIMFVTMIISNSQSAERAIADVYTVVKKHYFLSTLVLIFYCVISYIMMNNYIVGAKCVNFATVY
ncbi:MAG: hypothetical protein PUC33_04410, partial [Oscillospiraceae bacterium]|nr:hypothetical protein [Oscillospiraceae bacterium]